MWLAIALDIVSCICRLLLGVLGSSRLKVACSRLAALATVVAGTITTVMVGALIAITTVIALLTTVVATDVGRTLGQRLQRQLDAAFVVRLHDLDGSSRG